MLSKSDIITVDSTITFSYKDCGIEIKQMNNYMQITATVLSEKGYIIKGATTINDFNFKRFLKSYLRHGQQHIFDLIDKLDKKAKRHDEKIMDLF